MALYMIFTSCFKYWTEDTVHQLIIKKKNSKVIFPASISGGRAERMVSGVFQGRELGFLLILHREGQSFNLIMFWLGPLLAKLNG